MIHDMLPAHHSSGADDSLAEPHRRLMAAVLQAVVDDCRGGSVYRRSAGYGAIAAGGVRKALAYVANTDRAWPFSFENLCEALGLDAEGLREELRRDERSERLASGARSKTSHAGSAALRSMPSHDSEVRSSVSTAGTSSSSVDGDHSGRPL